MVTPGAKEDWTKIFNGQLLQFVGISRFGGT
jgi:hypothetical protein